MLTLKHFFMRPFFESDPDKTVLAQHLHVMTWFAIAAVSAYAAILPFAAPQLASRVFYLLPVLAAQVVILFCMRRGWVVFASSLSMGTFWAMLAVTAFVSGGVRSAPYGGNLLLILNAAILLGQRVAFGLAALSVLEGAILAWLEFHGGLPALSTTPLSALLLQTVYFIVGAGSLHFATFSIKEALNRAKRELTERRIAEDALRASEQKFRNFIEQSSEGLALIDERGLVIEWNSAQERISGLSRATALGMPLWDIQLTMALPERRRPEHYERIKHLLLDVLRSGEIPSHLATNEAEICQPDGRRIVAQQSVFPIKTDAGYQLGTVVRDITERKHAEAERERLIAELEAKNAELERFTYTVSHDLKSPLVTVKGFLGFLEQDASNGDLERLRGDIQRIREATDTMHRLLNDLLELSRIGRKMNPPQAVAFGDLVQEALACVAGAITERQVRVRVAADLPEVYGDRLRLVEVLQNLIENAIKFMGRQPAPTIEVGTQQRDQETIFYVADNGIGIDARYHEKIFGLFERLDPATEGTGIGLALIKRIVEVHSGRIWVESAGPGQGSTFYFTLGTRRT